MVWRDGRPNATPGLPKRSRARPAASPTRWGRDGRMRGGAASTRRRGASSWATGPSGSASGRRTVPRRHRNRRHLPRQGASVRCRQGRLRGRHGLGRGGARPGGRVGRGGSTRFCELRAHSETCERPAHRLPGNRHRMRYPEFRAAGLRVAVVEAGCKDASAPGKRAGMHWTVTGANAIIALRCAFSVPIRGFPTSPKAPDGHPTNLTCALRDGCPRPMASGMRATPRPTTTGSARRRSWRPATRSWREGRGRSSTANLVANGSGWHYSSEGGDRRLRMVLPPGRGRDMMLSRTPSVRWVGVWAVGWRP